MASDEGRNWKYVQSRDATASKVLIQSLSLKKYSVSNFGHCCHMWRNCKFTVEVKSVRSSVYTLQIFLN
jgi:hypothetical protein